LEGFVFSEGQSVEHKSSQQVLLVFFFRSLLIKPSPSKMSEEKSSIFEVVDNEYCLWVCAAYGDIEGINKASKLMRTTRDVTALMVAVVNGQNEAAEALRRLDTNFLGMKRKTKQEWKWIAARHHSKSTPVYVPVRHLFFRNCLIFPESQDISGEIVSLFLQNSILMLLPVH
jgi:hypothetical protein